MLVTDNRSDYVLGVRLSQRIRAGVRLSERFRAGSDSRNEFVLISARGHSIGVRRRHPNCPEDAPYQEGAQSVS